MAAAGAAMTDAASITLRPENRAGEEASKDNYTVPTTWDELMGMEYPDGPATVNES